LAVVPTSETPNNKPPWKAGEKAYRASGARSSVQRQRAKFLSFFVPWIPSWRMRLWLYRLIGINITGEGNYIGRECYLDTEYPELITLEPGSKLSPRVIIFCHSSNSDLLRPVKLGADSWVGAGAIIGPGVTVGAGAIVAAGAAVFANVPPGAIVIGSPARIVGKVKSPARPDSADPLTLP
jgi:acetyltransferase-like isoleucine patch superfamily enzyme